MIKAYKYRLHPNNEQITFFEKSFGCVRFVYNWSLNQRIEAYQKDGTRISWVESCKRLTELKKQGKSIIMISEELPELLGMSDRIFIMKNGKFNGEFKRSQELGEKDLIAKMI